MRYTTTSAKQTIALGKKLAKQFKGGEILALRGELGAGKTTLVKGIAAGLSIKKTITSPTFLLLRVYPVRHQTIKTLVHIDCYRLKNSQAIADIGFQEYAGRPDTVTVVEWPEKVKKLRPRQVITVMITLQRNLKTRQINVNYYAGKRSRNTTNR